MVVYKKPLHSYEQSLLLSAMFFDSKNITDLLNFFPDDQATRMNAAKDRFLALPRNERMTQIVLELRRLLLIDERRVAWIHESWIDDALLHEPGYLRGVIKKSLAGDAANNDVDYQGLSNKLPLSLIFRMFIERLTTAPQKTAIYDPALMRLQSLKGPKQDESFSDIGSASIDALGEVVNAKRLFSYLTKKGLTQQISSGLSLTESNPYHHAPTRQFFLRQLVTFDPRMSINCNAFAGLATAALYLSRYKYQWQRTIVLGLPKPLGEIIESIIQEAKAIAIDDSHHLALSRLLIAALEKTR